MDPMLVGIQLLSQGTVVASGSAVGAAAKITCEAKPIITLSEGG